MGARGDKDSASSDAALVKRVQEGDLQAYDVLVLRYQHKVLEIANRFVNNRSDAADIAQEAFIKAFRGIKGFRGDSLFYTWLYRIVVNCAKSFLEANAKHRYNVDVDAPEFEAIDTEGVLSTGDSPERILESDDLRQAVLKAFEALPEDLRQAVTLREVEGMSYEDIALVMKSPIGTVRSRIFRARQFIEAQMAELTGDRLA